MQQTELWGGGDAGDGGGAHAAAGLPPGAVTPDFSPEDFLRALQQPPSAVYVCLGSDGLLRAMGGAVGVKGSDTRDGAALAAAARLAPSGPQRTAVLEAVGGTGGVGVTGGVSLRVRLAAGLAPHSELLLWPDDALALHAQVPALSPRHIKGAGRYECACGARFQEPNTLKLHLYVGGGGPGDFWRRVISSLGNMTSRRSGGVTGGHQCPYCGRLYSRRYGLRIHVRTHTGARPLRCPHPRCARRFADPSNLNKHRRIHARDNTLQ